MKNQADSFLLLKSGLEIQIAKELCNQVIVTFECCVFDTLAQLRYEIIILMQFLRKNNQP